MWIGFLGNYFNQGGQTFDHLDFNIQVLASSQLSVPEVNLMTLFFDLLYPFERSGNFERSFWCLQFLPKTEQKHVP